MEIFWAQGYEATSIDDLTKATGLSRSSLYQAYSSKRGLLDATLGHYVTERVGVMLGALEEEGSGVDDIVQFFEHIAAVTEEYPNRSALGCLLTNTIAEMGNTDPEVRVKGDAYTTRLKSAFENALAGSASRGELVGDHNGERAELLATLTLGTFVRTRGNLEPTGIRALADSVASLVETWRGGAGA